MVKPISFHTKKQTVKFQDPIATLCLVIASFCTTLIFKWELLKSRDTDTSPGRIGTSTGDRDQWMLLFRMKII